MRHLILVILLFTSSFIFGQSVIFMSIVRDSIITKDIVGILEVYKQINDSTYYLREKPFKNQSMVSVDPGFYVFRYKFNNKTFTERLLIYDDESVIIINIPENDQILSEFNFSKVLFVSIGMTNLATSNRKEVYMEF